MTDVTDTRPPPTSAQPPAPRSAPSGRRRRLSVLALLVAAGLLWPAVSIGTVLARPGADGSGARLAEWARDHHLGVAVTWAERLQYDRHLPREGGLPPGGVPAAAGDGAGALSPAAPAGTAAPVDLRPLAAGPALPREGQWQAVVHDRGQPAVRVAYLRPDDRHTSFLAAVMWLDPRLLRMRLHPGYQDPGGSWATPDELTAQLRRTVAAAFPGGFRLNGASRGGFYDSGRVARPLRAGAASVVIYRDGGVAIGSWSSEVRMTPQVQAVRQNLDLLVDGGRLAASCASNSSPVWGRTVGNASFVPRTALGERRDGSLVFVNSPATTVCSLGRLLQDAGVVRGLELDINPEWSVGYYFTHPTGIGGPVVPHKSRADQRHPADRYLFPQSRDFLAFYLR